MLIKVCGMKIPSQIHDLTSIVDFIGFIFYKKSARFVKSTAQNIGLKKVGVFVNETESVIHEIVKREHLDYVQLHGSETPNYCRRIRSSVSVIKAFGIDKEFNFSNLNEYADVADYFLFDTKTIEHGGSGTQFDWQLLKNYDLDVPFFLSGGINPNSIDEIKNIKHPKLVGLDINSGFEISPANKNIEQIKKFIHEIK